MLPNALNRKRDARMRLTQVTATNYRCINDSSPVEIGDVTCLVGKNESGKTAFLQALRRLNPVEDSGTYDDVMDYPAKGFARYKKIRDKQPATVIRAVLELTDDELATIEQDFGEGVLRSREFTVTKGYGSTTTFFELDLDEAAAVRHLTADLELPAGSADHIRQAPSIRGLVEALGALEEPHSTVTRLQEKIASWRDSRLSLKLIDDYLGSSNLMPQFFYFDDYSVLQGIVSIPALKRRRDNRQLTEADRTMLALLRMVGATLEEFEDQSNFERLKRELEAAANSITDEVFEYWSQNNQLSVTLEISGPEEGAEPPLDEGPILRVRIHNQRHRATVPFDERSRGFVWFFSFLAYFSELEDQERDIVLLLDEPGLNLHATAQRDLLRFIDERLAPHHQVVYTTHSPFMIQADRLDRVRTVQDVDNEGTKISAEVFRTDNETVFPLQAALGYDLAQTLFVGEHNLLLEGPSDILYLQLLNEALAARGMRTLDERWVKVPVGGADKLATFVSLLGGNQLNVAVLMDVSSNSIQRIKNLQANAKLGPNALVRVGEVTGAKDADIEDLFDPVFYLSLVNGAYRKDLPGKLTPAKLPKGNPRIVRRLEQQFSDNNLAFGTFNHYLPADYFFRQKATLLAKLDDATLDRAEKLFDRINSLLP
jgi:predicted ATP-dependent endonuclease of OLD family